MGLPRRTVHVLPTVTRTLSPGILSRTMPGLVGLLFAVSQASAVVDFGAVSADLMARPFSDRALFAGLSTALGISAAAPVLRRALYGSPLQYLWPLPLEDRRLAGLVVPASTIAALPGAFVGTLGGVSSGLGVWLAATLGGLTWAARRPLLTAGFLMIGALSAGPWGVLVGAASLGLLRPVGRALRDGRPRGVGASRSAWMRRGPITALVQRDLLALLRTHPGTTIGVPLGLFVLCFAIQRQLHGSWAPGAIGTGSVVLVGFAGLLPGSVLGTLARIEGPAQLARVLPVSPVQRVAALLTVATLAQLPAVLGVLVGSTANGVLGAIRVVVLMLSFGALAVATLVHRTPTKRRDLVSHGVVASVFVTLFAFLGPWTTGPLFLVAATALVLAVRRLR